MIIYVLLVVLSIVIAPLTSIPLIPIVSQVWGVFLAAILTLIGGVIGSITAFYLARKYGKEYIEKFVSLDEVEKIEKVLPKKHVFFGLLGLRIVVPADILSYSLGLFTAIGFKMFFATTIIGLIPESFIFAYIGALPIINQTIPYSWSVNFCYCSISRSEEDLFLI